jgi:hypothetical protein
VIEYRPVPRELAEAEYLELFADAFPENRGTSLATAGHYRWKYRSPALGMPAFEFGAYAEGRLVGYYAALPYAYSIDGRVRPIAMVCDVMTHTRLRGAGIFTALGRHATQAMARTEMSFCTGYPVRPAVLPGHLKVGWEVLFPLPVYLKLLDAEPLLRERGAAWLGGPVRLLLGGYQAICRAGCGLSRRTPPPWQALSIDEFFGHPGYPEFFRRWSAQYPHFLVKTEPFLRWRLGAPSALYCMVAVACGDARVALAITRRTELKGLDVVAVLDLMIPPECLHLAGAVHDALAAHARETRAAGIALMCTQPDALRWQLAAHGYWKAPYTFQFILKWLAAGPPPEALRDPARWHLMWIDSDDL